MSKEINKGSYKQQDIIIDGIIYSMQEVGGISRIFSEILPRICDQDPGIHFRLILNKKNIQELPKHENIKKIDTYRVENILLPRRMWKRRLPRIKQEIDLLASGDTRNKLFHSTYYTVPRRWKGPKVATVYDMIHEKFESDFFQSKGFDYFRKEKRETIFTADKIISISETTKNDLISFFGITAAKIQVIYPAYNPIFQKMADYQPRDQPFFLYLGGRSKYKNFLGFLQAYAKWSKNKNIALEVVGPEWSEAEREAIISLKSTQNIRLVQSLDDLSLRNLYNQAVAFIFPSLYEGFGIPLLEAMACGCPIIASRIPSTVEVAQDVPFYHEPGNQDQMIDNLDQVYNQSGIDAKVEEGMKLVKSFSWERTAELTANLYRSFS